MQVEQGGTNRGYAQLHVAASETTAEWRVKAEVTKRITSVGAYTTGSYVPLTTPLTSTSWNGDSYSTTAKTKIDLSSVFSAPAGIKAIEVYVALRDSGSDGAETWMILAPNDTANQGKYFACSGLSNDEYAREGNIVPCDANGDIYYQINASGSGTMDVWIEIWGYWV